VLDLIRWMRHWNSDPAHQRKVKFYGFDMQQTTRAAKNALSVLRAIDPGEAGKAAGILESLANPYLSERARASVAAGTRVQEIDSTLQVLAERFEARRSSDLRIANERELTIARQNVRILQQWMAMVFKKEPTARDRAMAENIQWILAHEGSDTKMVVWAHNGHVSKADPSAGSDGMGSYLRAALGNDMVVFGFAFDRGGFQAIDGSSARELKAFTVGPALKGSLDDALSSAGLRIAALDLRRLPTSGEVADWFATRRPTRMIGSGYIDSLGERYFRPIVPPRHFDAILFVDSTTAARRNPRGERPPVLATARASNLDFEEGAAGSPPPGWTGPARLAADHYHAEIRKSDSGSGLLCGGLRSLGARAYGERFGSLSQLVDATPYRGRRVRMSALVRVEPASPSDEAFLYMKVSGGPPGREEDLFYDGMEDRPIATKEWQRYTIEGNVPANANTVSFGLAFVGDGSAWLDSVSLEPVALSGP
jgi:erythromycin esterase